MAGLLVVDGRLPAVVAGSSAPHAQAGRATADPDAACAGCHREIYERYRATPMANASGIAAEGFLPARFTHAASAVSYRVEESGGHVWLDFERDDPVRELKGRRELKYFLGSGTRGRTYLFEDQGYWFEIPINWYAKKQIWDMAPNYQQAREMPLVLPVDPGCLRCHASGAQPSLPEARNKYVDAPFTEGGITCAACHGDTTAHVNSGGRVALLKLSQLEPVHRDSICLSCHLEGQEAVVHESKRLVDFRPGESIFDYASFFVRGGRNRGSGQRATSQWEALLASGCRRGAGDKLTCTSCHDPHGSTVAMRPEERISYYREKCLACHDPGAAAGKPSTGFAATHHAENRDCASCHMPRATANDIAHEQVTDHRIPRFSREKPAPFAGLPDALVPIGDGTTHPRDRDSRDLGLAYAQKAVKGDSQAAARARSLLTEAALAPGAAGDHELHSQLGFLDQLAGDKEGAAREYSLALATDPNDSLAAGNLALLKAGEWQYIAAAELWQRAFQDDPVQLQAGRNLALVECGLGKKEAALGTLDRILEFSPDDGQVRELAHAIRSGRHGCGVH